jgi:hypothetical protein
MVDTSGTERISQFVRDGLVTGSRGYELHMNCTNVALSSKSDIARSQETIESANEGSKKLW